MVESQENLPKAALWRRFAAMVYDSVLLFAVLWLAGIVVYPITHGQNSPVYNLYLFVVMFLYFSWQWRHGGQTLGMKTWRVQLRAVSDQPVTWWQTLVRFMISVVSLLAFGLGFFWSLWDAQRRTWHDQVSNTQLVVLPKDYYRM